MAFKHKVQSLTEAGWLTFQEDRPNVKTNPFTNHGEGVVNAVESGRPRRSKPLKDVTTPKRFIYEALQKGGEIPRGGHEKDSYLMHPSALHNIEACLAVEDPLQQMINQGWLEVGDEGGEEKHICMQSADEEGLRKPKPLVIHFTRDTAPFGDTYSISIQKQPRSVVEVCVSKRKEGRSLRHQLAVGQSNQYHGAKRHDPRRSCVRTP